MNIPIEVEEQIQAPPEVVWKVLTDVEGMAKWMPGFVKVEPQTPGPFAVGYSFVETRQMYGHESHEHFTVEAVEPGRAFTFFIDGTRGTSRRGWYRFVHTLTPMHGGTRVKMVGEIGGLGWFARLIARLMVGSMKGAILGDLQALKLYIEDTTNGVTA